MEIACWDDMDEQGAELTPLESLMQDNYHRLTDAPGSNIDDSDWGLGLPLLLSGKEEDLISAGPRSEAELRKDPRNAEVRTTITKLGKEEYDVAIAIVPDPEELGSVESEQILRLRIAGGKATRVIQ